MELVGEIKNYDWGKVGSDSIVAKLASFNCNEFIVDNHATYAELWMGDHESGPARIKTGTRELLSDYMQKNWKTSLKNVERLPFLLKVLSVRKALSVQVHPNKCQAEELHRLHPDIYKDDNHKPELAVALTPFKALCSFRSYVEIKSFLVMFPFLANMLNAEEIDDINLDLLKTIFSSLMNLSKTQVQLCIDYILQHHIEDLKRCNLYDVFNTLNKDFPADCGILCIFFLNFVELKPGEAIFLAANEPHAYLEGDCIECMACSDNVVRAGLTPKFRDVSTLLQLLNYHPKQPKELTIRPEIIDDCLIRFKPNIEDFILLNLRIKPGLKYRLNNLQQGSIMLVLSGASCMITNNNNYPPLNLSIGSIVFIPVDCGPLIEISVSSDSKDEFNCYIATQNY